VADGDARWNRWDCDIQMIVHDFNRRFAGYKGYQPLDWRLVKAMLWTESGPHDPDWNFKPMQAGVGSDPGVTSFLSGNEGGDVIALPDWKGKVTERSARSVPRHNLYAGIGYLLMRLANFDYKNVPDIDTRVYEVTVKPGDSFDKVAKAQGSTVETMKKLNPSANPHFLKAGQVLKYQKASMKRVITGWQHVTTSSIATNYNGGRTPTYASRLNYAYSAVRKMGMISCAK
ncbi:MAG: LysM domain-containing protein, partial [Burkholderiaceae bacterium]|nr:LysM domain-containing protein [Burkholderiaceae bacterium]